jgi:hypothetical protein
LKKLADHYPGISGVFDESAAKRGYDMKIRELLAQADKL